LKSHLVRARPNPCGSVGPIHSCCDQGSALRLLIGSPVCGGARAACRVSACCFGCRTVVRARKALAQARRRFYGIPISSPGLPPRKHMRAMALEGPLPRAGSRYRSRGLIYRNPIPRPCVMLCAWKQARPGRNSMLDILILALGLGLFVAAVGYTYACERL
jgi:hypothetical protein